MVNLTEKEEKYIEKKAGNDQFKKSMIDVMDSSGFTEVFCIKVMENFVKNLKMVNGQVI